MITTLFTFALLVIYVIYAVQTFMNSSHEPVGIRIILSIALPICDFMVLTSVIAIIGFRILNEIYLHNRGYTIWERIKHLLPS